MFALDFKLTSAQVKVLLTEWHGHDFRDLKPRPARDLFDSKSWASVCKTLVSKGLLEPVDPSLPWSEFAEHRVTPMGSALAETIVLQAQKILSLDASRREFQAELPAIRAEWAERLKPAVLPEILVRRKESPDAQ